MTYLVSFQKGEEVQYHCFTDCKVKLEFVHDLIFRKAIFSGYTWSAIPFNERLAFTCDWLTISKVEYDGDGYYGENTTELQIGTSNN